MAPIERRLRVLDWGTGLPAGVAVRLLDGAGVTVLRVRDEVHAAFEERYPALSWWYRDVEAVDPADVNALLPEIDVCLVGGEDHPGCRRRDAVTAAALRERFEHLVVVEMAGYVRGEPAVTPAADLLVQARTGFVFEQFEGRPTQMAFAPTLYGTGMLAAMGAWTALLKRMRTGTGDLVRVSMQQALALFWPHQWLTATEPDLAFSSVPPRDVEHLIFRCKDGDYLQLVLGVPSALAKLHGVLGIPGPADPTDRGVPSLARGPRSYFADKDVLEPAIETWHRDELVRALKDQGLAVEPVLAPGGCFGDPQVAASGLIETDGTGLRYAAAPVELVPARAPAHRTPPDGLPRDAPASRAAPLAGIRVVDIGNWVAGPYSSKLLADLGADVISIEPPTGLSNLTGMRNTLAANRGKRSVVLDVKSEAGATALRELIATSDVVTHNFRLGVAERLGLGAERLRAGRPDLIYLHTTAYGRLGPKAGDSGFDMVMQALCGHEVRAGGAGNPPLWYRAPFVDYAAGALGAIGVLAALYRRAVTGAGADVHTSLLASAMFIRGEFAVDSRDRAIGSPLLGPERTGMRSSESLYRAADGWVAVYAPTPVTRSALRAALGVPDTPPAEADGRAAARLAAAVARRTVDDVLGQLEAAGVWATACTADAFESMLRDPAARRANLVIETPDPRFGTVIGCYGPLVEFSGWTPGPKTFRPAPLPGEHTEQVLAELRGRRRGTCPLPPG